MEPTKDRDEAAASPDRSARAGRKRTASDAVDAVSETISDIVEGVEHIGSAVGSRARPLFAEVAQEVGEVAKGAQRVARRASAGTGMGRSSRERLPSLYRVHPEARNAARRERGLRVVPLDEIAGTTVDSVARGMDFLPLASARTRGWQARWQRILSAVDRLIALPPVELLRYGDRYWVVDGHNRIAAARRVGQVGVDADVVELIGDGPSEPATPIAEYLDPSGELRALGSGRRPHVHAEHGDDGGPP